MLENIENYWWSYIVNCVKLDVRSWFYLVELIKISNSTVGLQRRYFWVTAVALSQTPIYSFLFCLYSCNFSIKFEIIGFSQELVQDFRIFGVYLMLVTFSFYQNFKAKVVFSITIKPYFITCMTKKVLFILNIISYFAVEFLIWVKTSIVLQWFAIEYSLFIIKELNNLHLEQPNYSYVLKTFIFMLRTQAMFLILYGVLTLHI